MTRRNEGEGGDWLTNANGHLRGRFVLAIVGAGIGTLIAGRCRHDAQQRAAAEAAETVTAGPLSSQVQQQESRRKQLLWPRDGGVPRHIVIPPEKSGP